MGASEVSVPMLPSPLTSPAGLQVEENGRNLLGRHVARVSPVSPVKLGCGLLITVLAAAVLGLSVALSVRKREEVIKSPVYGTCPENWILFGSKCFYFSEDTRNWAESQAFCKELGAELAQFENLEELNVLMRYKGASAHWIGLSRDSSGQPWKWMDGTEYNNMYVFRPLSFYCVCVIIFVSCVHEIQKVIISCKAHCTMTEDNTQPWAGEVAEVQSADTQEPIPANSTSPQI